MKGLENGTIKIVWTTRTGKKVHSKMFNSLNEAKKFAKTKNDFLIFKLIKHKKMNEFEWEVLNGGNSKIYLKLLKFYRNNHLDKII